jgi:Protein of unknown function DUF262
MTHHNDGSLGGIMAINVVNLDAMIPHEDFAIESENKGGAGSGNERIDLASLSNNFFSSRLRKPDFQRETARWTPSKVADLIRSFLDGDLIPAVIFWEQGSFVFVIDGAHRLSALLAWIYDDYGDQKRSLELFDGRIPDDQRRIAEKTRALVKTQIGAYAEYEAAAKNPVNISIQIGKRAAGLPTKYLTAQWARAEDAKAAQASFVKINQSATPIDPTELRIINARESANAMAARAITRAGTGYKYWADFSGTTRQKIQQLGREIYTALYNPPMQEGPISTLDLPLAGKGYNVLPFVFDLVNQINHENISDSTNKKNVNEELPIDDDGSKTVEFLTKVKKLLDRITGDNPAAMGFHPVVYFYNRSAGFQPTALLAVCNLSCLSG